MKVEYMLVTIFLLSLTIVSSQELTIQREVTNDIKIGDLVSITISITNPSSTSKKIKVTETLPQTIELIDPPEPTETRFFNAVSASLLIWERTIPQGGTEIIAYKIKPITLGENSIMPTRIEDVSTGAIISTSDQLNFLVNCVPNAVCDEDETYISCPQDCSSGSADGICNYKLDGECDPDCENDPDCGKKEFTISIIHILIVSVIILIIIAFFVLKNKGKRVELSNSNQETL